MSIYTVNGGGLRAKFIPRGATLMDLRLEGHSDPLVLGFDDPALYPEHSPYFGATAGRYANRIGNACFQIDGTSYQTDPNFLGKHTLHGGAKSIGKRDWDVLEVTADTISFGITAEDGDMGFPGALTIRADFELKDQALHVRYTATTDQPTLCNLAHHTYWALDGSGGLDHHLLQVAADSYTPVNDELIPTGEIAPVAGTRFDFTKPATLLSDQVIDHNLCLSGAGQPLRSVGTLRSTQSGISMDIATTEPGLQVYNGAKVAPKVAGLDGRRYGPYAGVALEPQIWPDAPNHSGFPDAVLRPGETYRQHTVFTFSKD